MNAAEIRSHRIRNVNRSPGFNVVAWRSEARRHDTNNCVDVAAQRNCLAEDLLVTTKLVTPQGVTQNDDKGGAVLVVFSCDGAASLWLNAERIKVAAGNLTNLKLHRLAACGIVQRLLNFTTKTTECVTLRLDVRQVRSRLV